MAMVNYGTVLEYSPNTITLILYGDNNEEVPFDADTTFNIKRADNSTFTYSVEGAIEGNSIVFLVDPPKDVLKLEGDSVFNTDDGITHHIYSVKSSTKVYMQGKLKLVEVA